MGFRSMWQVAGGQTAGFSFLWVQLWVQLKWLVTLNPGWVIIALDRIQDPGRISH